MIPDFRPESKNPEPETRNSQPLLAERVGFEPTVPFIGTTVFETVRFNHSRTSPEYEPDEWPFHPAGMD